MYNCLKIPTPSHWTRTHHRDSASSWVITRQPVLYRYVWWHQCFSSIQKCLTRYCINQEHLRKNLCFRGIHVVQKHLPLSLTPPNPLKIDPLIRFKSYTVHKKVANNGKQWKEVILEQRDSDLHRNLFWMKRSFIAVLYAAYRMLSMSTGNEKCKKCYHHKKIFLWAIIQTKLQVSVFIWIAPLTKSQRYCTMVYLVLP